MDDKKINLLPDNLRFKEEKTKRPLSFSPDFKNPGKKEKPYSYKPSGGQVSVWSRIFKRDQKAKITTPEAPKIPNPTISYNNENKQAGATNISPVTMHVPETMTARVEEHIQDFVPAQAKIKASKPKGPSFWSRLFKKSPAKAPKKVDTPIVANTPKAQDVSVDMAMHQPEIKPDIQVFQDFNKQTEETNNFIPKKIQEHVSEVVKEKIPVEPVPVVKPEPKIELVPAKVVPAKIKEQKPKGPSWWSRFLALFKSKPKNKKIKSSPSQQNSKSDDSHVDMTENKKQPDLKTFRELNKQVEDTYSFDVNKTKNEPVQPKPDFDLTSKVSEELNLTPLESADQSPEPVKPATPVANDFIMPEYAPKADKVDTPISNISIDKPNPKVTGPQFHMPEAGPKSSLLNGSVDLIPIAARVRSWKQISALLGLSIVLSLLILGVIYGYTIFTEQRIIAEQNNKKAEIAKIEAKILNFTELNKNISTLGQEIQLIQDTLNKHIYWTNFFSLLEKYTVADVYYSGLAVGTNGGLTLDASTKSYDSVAKQLKVLNSDAAQEFVKEASITGANKDQDGNVSFQIVLTLNQNLFYWSAQ